MKPSARIFNGLKRRIPPLRHCLAWWSFHRCHCRIRGSDNIIAYDPTTRFGRSSFDIEGHRNRITLGRECRLAGVRFVIRGDDHSLVIGDDCWIHPGTLIWFEDDHGRLEIGAKTEIQQVHLAVVEPRCSIRIGPNCLFSHGIEIRTSDSHSILDLAGNRLNGPRDVLIGEHTWVGAHTSLLKGAEIAGDTVVATRSVVTRKFTERNIVIGGAPATILRREATWTHARLPAHRPDSR